MFRRTFARHALRRASAVLADTAPAAATTTSPSTASSTFHVKSVFQAPTKLEIIEAIGYPGQKGGQSTHQGLVTTLGRVYYGPGRYDYGRPVMPSSAGAVGWFKNFFYPIWEFHHLFFVADRWVMYRMIRHLIGISICFYPLWLSHKWGVAEQEYMKKCQSGGI